MLFLFKAICYVNIPNIYDFSLSSSDVAMNYFNGTPRFSLSACLYCVFIEAISWLDCSFRPWRWNYKIGIGPLLVVCWIFYQMFLRTMCYFIVPCAGTRRSCYSMRGIEGKFYGISLFFFFALVFLCVASSFCSYIFLPNLSHIFNNLFVFEREFSCFANHII